MAHILIVHTRYQIPGGEDAVVESEVGLLRAHGHRVTLYQRDNAELQQQPAWTVAVNTLYSRRAQRQLGEELDRHRPDLVHVHNTFPLLSPAIHHSIKARGLPCVQTLHNFRLFCLQAQFLRGGRVCEDCLGHAPWRGVVHGCYRGSRAASAVTAAMLGTHRLLGTWQRLIDRYIALNDFCRELFIRGGLPAERIAVKPNFLDAPALADPLQPRHGAPLFVGRLSDEKGIATLIEASRQPGLPRIDVVGSGPLQAQVAAAPGLRLIGPLPAAEVYRRMLDAPVLLLPSLWYENFPRTLVEAWAHATPVIASRIGALATLIDEGHTGLLTEPGSPADLARALRWAMDHPVEMRRIGAAGHRRQQRDYSAAANHARLLEIYREAGLKSA